MELTVIFASKNTWEKATWWEVGVLETGNEKNLVTAKAQEKESFWKTETEQKKMNYLK